MTSHRHRPFVALLIVLGAVLGAGATAHAGVPQRDDVCAGWYHRGFGVDPSFVRIGGYFGGGPGSEGTAFLDGAGRTVEATAAADDDGYAQYDLGINLMTTFDWRVEQDGSVVVSGTISVVPEEKPCEKSLVTAPTSSTTSTTTSSSTTTTTTTTPTASSAAPPVTDGSTGTATDTGDGGDGDDRPWVLILVGGLGLFGVGIVVLFSKGDPCPPLIKACEEARAAAVAARAAAARARTAAAGAATAHRDARLERDRAARRAKLAEREPSPGDWVEMDGERITTHDLRLRRRAAAASLAAWRGGDKTAAQVEQEWASQAGSDGLERLRAEDAAERAARRTATAAALAAAEAAVAAAAAAQEAAEAAAAKAEADALEAQRRADEACALAARCRESAHPIEDEPDPPVAPPTPPTAPPPGEPGLSPPDEDDDHPCHCGLDVTELFLRRMNTVARRLEEGWDPGLVGQAAEFLGDKLLSLVWFTQDVATSGTLPAEARRDRTFKSRSAYGLVWLLDNGTNMDFWLKPDDECPCCDECSSTPAPPTLLGECLAPHNLGDFLYGFCCGWWGVPNGVQDLGGVWVEHGKAKQDETVLDSWDKEAVSRPLYAAGSALGNQIRESEGVITEADLAGLMAAADRLGGSCQPCPKKATEFSMKDFTTKEWSW